LAGGSLLEGARLAAAIKVGRFQRRCPGSGLCLACFWPSLPAIPKFAGYGALIGVAQSLDKSGRETEASGEATLLMGRFAKTLVSHLRSCPDGIDSVETK